MKFVNEDNDFAGILDLIYYSLDPFLELSTVFCPGDHEGEVKDEDFFIPEYPRDFSCMDGLGESFDNCSFPDTSLAD